MPPVVIAAGVAAAGTVAGGVIASKGTKSAAKTQQEGTNAGIAAQERAYNQSAAALAPWQQSGLNANALLMDAYGMGQPAQQQLPAQQPNAMQAYGGMMYEGQDGPMGGRSPFETMGGDIPQGFGMQGTASTPSGVGGSVMQATQAPQARSAFDTFKNSLGYNWQLGQGLDAVNSGYAGAGTLQSGAAMKGINDYAQNFAQGAYQSWLGGVGDLANRGFGAASAQAGVSQKLGNNSAALLAANGNNQANIGIARANALGGTINGLTTIGANVLGGMGQTPPYNPGAVSTNGGLSGTIINTRGRY